MSFWTRFREPREEDFATQEEYEEAVARYERAEDSAIEDCLERSRR